MRIFLIASLILFLQTNSISQNCKCDSTFIIVKTLVENNYAGWFDKTSSFNTSDFQTITDAVALKVKSITNDSLCVGAIKSWIGYFNDGHLRLNFYPTKNKSKVKNDKLIEIQHVLFSEMDFKKYLKTKKPKDKIEGIWDNSSYKIAIKREINKPNLFDGIVISSKNENWKPGEIKLKITKLGTEKYNLNYISGDKTVELKEKAKLVKNILDGNNLLLSKTFPIFQNPIDLNDYEIENDPTGPKLNFVGSDLAVFTFPNFYSQNYETVQFLLKKYSEKLKTYQYWIIDLRDNEGGDVQVGNLLLPYLFTKPIVSYKTKARLTAENYNNWYNSYVKASYMEASVSQQVSFDSLATIVKSKFGTFGNIYNENQTADTLIFKEIRDFPQKVGIIINNQTISSGELFTILAKFSDKVKIFGQNSSGTIDYGNILKYPTNCPTIKLTLPSDRYNWLDYGISIDRDKIKPDFYIYTETKDWVNFTYSKLKK